MPLVRISMLKGKTADYLDALSKSIYDSLVEAFQVPKGDLFQVFEQLDVNTFRYNREYRSVEPRTDDFIIISIQSPERSRSDKEALMKRLLEKLIVSPGISPQDVFVYIFSGMHLEDLSFGYGKSALK